MAGGDRRLRMADAPGQSMGDAVESLYSDMRMRAMMHRAVQRRLERRATAENDPAVVREAAQQGTSGDGGPLPHRDALQRALGPAHDLSSIRAHVGGAATGAAERMGARAFATGEHIAFKESPDLHTTAHEVAHVLHQRRGVAPASGVGEAGDAHERNADEFADAVTSGRAASGLIGAGGGARASAVQHRLDGNAPVQMEKTPTDTSKDADQLLRDIISGKNPKFAEDLGVGLPPPQKLLDFLKAMTNEKMGPDQALQMLLSEELTPVPDEHKDFASGTKRGQSRQFQDEEVKRFFAELFHAVAYAANQQKERVKSIKLHDQDLFHAHMAPYVSKPGAGPDGGQIEELVMVFHAKEYPRGVRSGAQEKPPGKKWEDQPPEGDAKPGDKKDLTNTDADFRLRNFIYLVKAQRLIAIDPAKGASRGGFNERTFGVDEGLIHGGHQGEALAEGEFNADKAQNVDVNYFPEPGRGPQPDRVLAGPTKTEAFGADKFLRNARTAEQLRGWIAEFSQDELKVAIANLPDAPVAGVSPAEMRRLIEARMAPAKGAPVPSAQSPEDDDPDLAEAKRQSLAMMQTGGPRALDAAIREQVARVQEVLPQVSVEAVASALARNGNDVDRTIEALLGEL